MKNAKSVLIKNHQKFNPKRVLTCGFERARRELPESSIISEKGAIHVELWPKHSKQIILVPMLYMTFLDRTSLIRLILNSSQKRFPRRIKNECCVPPFPTHPGIEIIRSAPTRSDY